MATKLTKIVHNCETGVTEEVELTAEEIAQIKADQDAMAASVAAQAKEETDRQALKASAIKKLTSGQPLTDAEASLLVI